MAPFWEWEKLLSNKQMVDRLIPIPPPNFIAAVMKINENIKKIWFINRTYGQSY